MSAATLDAGPVLELRSSLRRRGPALAAVLVGAVAAAAALERPVVALVTGFVVAILVIGDRPPAATVVGVGLVFSNAVVIATGEHAVPRVLAALIPLLLLITIGYWTCILRRPVVLPRATPWVVGLLVVQIVAGATSRDPATSLAAVTTLVTEGLLLWILLANAARSVEVLRACAIALVAVAAALSVLSVAQEAGLAGDGDAWGFAQVSEATVGRDGATGEEGRNRHAGPIGEKNRWAQSLALVVPLAVALAGRDRSRAVRLFGAASIPVVGAGIVLTYSRGAAVGLVLAALVAIVLGWVPRAATLGAVVMAVVALTVVAPVFASRAATVVTARGPSGGEAFPLDAGSGTDSSFANRAVEASAATAVFVHHPLVGVGPGLFPTYFQDEARRMGAERIVGVDREAHNLYLGVAAESGILGVVALAGVVATMLGPLVAVRRRLRTTRPDVAALATGYALALVVYLATGLFLHFAYIRYFWLFAGLAAAMGLVGVGTGSGRRPVALGAVGSEGPTWP